MSKQKDWTDIKLGDLADGVRGVSYQPSDLLNEHLGNTVTLLRANNIQDGRLLFDDIQIVPEKLVKPSQKMKKGDIAVCMSNGSKRLVGKSAQMVDSNGVLCTVGAFCSVFRPKDGVNHQYVKQLFGSRDYQAHIDISLSGSAINNLKNSDIELIPISVPPQDYQEKVGGILATIDQTIKKTEALIEKHQQIKAGLMHDLFTHGITANGKLRPTREQAPELYQETPIGWIPKGWDLRSMRSIASYQHGRPFPSTDYSEDGILLLRPGNLHVSGFVVFNESHSTRIPKSWGKIASLFLVENYDIVMNLTAQSLDDQFLGRVCINEGNEKALLNQRIARFTPSGVEHKFLYWILKSAQFRNPVDRTSQGTKVQHLYNRDIDRVKFGIPIDVDEQKRIAATLDCVTEKLRKEQGLYKKLKKTKSGLMHDLLTGKVPVTIEEPEAAHV